ncbi:MAG TPA: hypothetical protein VFL64_01105 [Rhizobacter sp.]|nr:hypothetical protein [Rhizobacter sp.]
MADLINPRLFARVERSLRKRLNTNVKPHLTRCAAHARSEDEFMAAAARMLINPQQRQEWLASWATRRHSEAHDTTPAELDTTTPAALDAPLQRSFRITPAQRERVREALAHELGPIADLLLENESQRAESVSELLERLESHLDGDEQRTRFRHATVSSKIAPDA